MLLSLNTGMHTPTHMCTHTFHTHVPYPHSYTTLTSMQAHIQKETKNYKAVSKNRLSWNLCSTKLSNSKLHILIPQHPANFLLSCLSHLLRFAVEKVTWFSRLSLQVGGAKGQLWSEKDKQPWTDTVPVSADKNTRFLFDTIFVSVSIAAVNETP